jgi:UDP-N-acetyl-D-glucosamine dehydrogenase
MKKGYNLKKNSVPITKGSLKKYECVVISTDHSSYDYEFILKHAPLIVDTRNAMSRFGQNRKVVKA